MKLRTSGIKGPAMAGLLGLCLAGPITSTAKEGTSNVPKKVSAAKENVAKCLSGESLARSANHGLAGLITAVQLSEQCKPSATKKDFWESFIRISKRSLPEISIVLEDAWLDQEAYYQLMNFFFDSGYFFNPDDKTIVKIEEKIDISTTVPELSCLFWGSEPLQYARIWRIKDGWNPRRRWVVFGSAWIVDTHSLQTVYDRVHNKSLHSYKDIERWVIAHEATHSILWAYYDLRSTLDPYWDLPDVNQWDIHEYLGFTGWYCVNDHPTEAMLVGILREIKFDWSVPRVGKVPGTNYSYTYSALLWYLSQVSRSSEITKILEEQYNANSLNGLVDLFEDTGRLSRAKAIMWLLTTEDREMIQRGFIEQGKVFIRQISGE